MRLLFRGTHNAVSIIAQVLNEVRNPPKLVQKAGEAINGKPKMGTIGAVRPGYPIMTYDAVAFRRFQLAADDVRRGITSGEIMVNRIVWQCHPRWSFC